MSGHVFQAVMAAPGFSIGVACNDSAITLIEYLPPGPVQPARHPLAQTAVAQLHNWLQNPDTVFDLPLAPAGTAFQQRVWQAICAIPRGETRRYGDLSRQLVSAPRAVGGACGANPYPIVVPCHRVVASSGLGGFAHARSGLLLEIKHWLLRHEGALPD